MDKHFLFCLLSFIVLILTIFSVNAAENSELDLAFDHNNKNISISWDDYGKDKKYEVYVNGKLEKTLDENFFSTKGENNKFYTIKLNVLDRENELEKTLTESIYTGKVSNLTIFNRYNKTLKISYHKEESASGYHIYKSVNNSSYKEIKTNDASTLNYEDNDIKNNTRYKYKVIPYKKENGKEYLGYSDKEVTSNVKYNNEKKSKDQKFNYEKVTNVSAVQTEYNKVKICFKKNNTATGYEVYRAAKRNGNYKKIISATNNCIYHNKLALNRTYYYKIRAYKLENGKTLYGKYSNIVSKRIRLMKPQVKVLVRQHNNLRIEYKKVPHASKYYIYRATSKNGKYKLVKRTKNLSYKDKKLKSYTTYYYKVRAFASVNNKNIYSKNSNIVQETTSERNAPYKLNLKSSYGDNQAYHPDVLYFPNKWHGYKYWLVYTPYPGVKGTRMNGDASKENPHIKASNDLKNWHVVSNHSNPLDDPKVKLNQNKYNSDAELVYNNDLNRIECFWRFYTEDEITLFMSYTNDGLYWSEKEIVLKVKTKENILLSPSIIYENGTYKLWYINDWKFHYEEYKTTPFNNSKNSKTFDINYKKQKVYPWHLDVIKNNNRYEMLYVGTIKKESIKFMSLYYSNSSNGKNWMPSKKILSPSVDQNAWDNRGIYRSTFFHKDGKYYVIYSASNKKNIKGTGILYGKDITGLYPLFN